MILTNSEKKLLLFINSLGGKETSVQKASKSLTMGADQIRSAAEKLVHLGFITKENLEQSAIEYTDEGEKAQKDGLAEVQLLKMVLGADAKISGLSPYMRQFGISWAKKKGWVQTSNGLIVITDVGKEAAKSAEYLSLPKDASDLLGSSSETIKELERRGLVKLLSRVQDTTLSLTSQGALQAAKTNKVNDKDGVASLTRDMIISGGWRSKSFTKYDINASGKTHLAPRRHPINRLSEKIKQIFVQMGFEEMQGPLAESSFWNFDALFQPQDHPARDLADTFYLKTDSELPPSELVSRVQKSHESGWGYSWNRSTAKRQVLRTHTTSVSARTLYENRNDSSPKKFFSIGKVFRNEATDYKHLAEFFQVEGIISWEGATFRHLLTTLREFYHRLGFEKIRFRPSYFPYTEPSLEIEVYYEDRKEWIELGGAGIFRPEVTLPICNKFPVLAWGLSLERPLMLSNEIDDIRTFYRNDLNWLRNFKTKI